MAQTTINNGDTGLVARTAMNNNFSELYSRADAYVSAAAASAAITGAAYLNVLANATLTDAGLTGSDWTIDDTNKRITHTGTNTIVRKVTICFSMTSTKSNEVARFKLATAAGVIDASEISRKIGTGADVGAAAIQATITFATNTYVELHGTLDTSSSDTITIDNANIAVE